MQRAKILKMANFIRHEIKDEDFDLRLWCNGIDLKCGTVACVVGWVPTAFPRSGMKLVKNEGMIKPRYTDRKKKVYWEFDAAAKFFGITHDEAFDLFEAGSYDELDPDRYVVAEKMERLARGIKVPS